MRGFDLVDIVPIKYRMVLSLWAETDWSLRTMPFSLQLPMILAVKAECAAMKVLVPINTAVTEREAVMAKILDRGWPVGTTFYLLDVIGDKNGCPLEMRVKALSGMMRALEQKLPQSAVFIEVMKEGPADFIAARAAELEADVILPASNALSPARC